MHIAAADGYVTLAGATSPDSINLGELTFNGDTVTWFCQKKILDLNIETKMGSGNTVKM